VGKCRQAEVVRRVQRVGVGDGDHLRPSERRTAAGANVDERARCAARANLARAAPIASGAARDESVRRALTDADHAAADNAATVTASGRHSRRLVALSVADGAASCTDPGRHARRADNDDSGRHARRADIDDSGGHARRADNDGAAEQLGATFGVGATDRADLDGHPESGIGSGDPR
jgi:hypothetical protein